ncbi:MAG: phosphodiester glycosidase family protein [Armatimonadetes bacterium]|nr:phosphodiester glycosidase family protein [Armatimonadota bacterium]MDW8122982.1 phosphodiester glycosidase family protein [Armatimonadota bacterium]
MVVKGLLKNLIFLVIFQGLLGSTVSGQVSYRIGVRILGEKVHYVVVNPMSSDLVVTPVYVPGGAPFSTMVALYRPMVAINGSFFNIKTMRPVGDVVIASNHIQKGFLRTALLLQGPFAFILTLPNDADLTGRVDAVLACGPRLLREGRVGVFPAAEGFKDKSLYRPARRSAVGVTLTGKLILAVVATPTTLTKTAQVMKTLGCWDAMNLDGGTSSALYVDGKFVVRPGRNLVTALMVLRLPTMQAAAYRPN